MSESPDPTYDPPLGTFEIHVVESKGLKSSLPPQQKEKDLFVKVYIADFEQQQRKALTKTFTCKQVKWAESLTWNFSVTTPIYEKRGLLVFEVMRAGSLLGSSTPFGSVAYRVADLLGAPSNVTDSWMNMQDSESVTVGQIRVMIKFIPNLADSFDELKKEPVGTYKFKVFQSSIHQATISNMFDSEKCHVATQRCNNSVAKWLNSVAPLVQVININTLLEPMSPDVLTTVWYRIVDNGGSSSSNGNISNSNNISDATKSAEPPKQPVPPQSSDSMLISSSAFDFPYPGTIEAGKPATTTTTETFVISDSTDPFQ